MYIEFTILFNFLHFIELFHEFVSFWSLQLINYIQKKPVSRCDSAAYLEQQSSEASSEDEPIVSPVTSAELTVEHCSCCKYVVVSVGEFNS